MPVLACRLDEDARTALGHVTPELEQIRIDQWARMIADGYALLGRKDDAIRWMRIVIDCGYINYTCLSQHDPFLESVRAEPEFQAMMDDLRKRWEAVPESDRQPLKS